jgi:putative membrane protein
VAVFVGVLAHGGEGLEPFTPAALFTEANPFSAVALGVLAVGALYLWGVSRLRRRGDRWARARTSVFFVGLAAVASVTVSGLAAYDTTLLSVHMVQHMVLSMLAPIFLALGAPVTLALRTLPSGPRQVLLSLLHSRFGKVMTFPIVSFGLFVASPFVLYFSDLYRVQLQYPVVHDLIHVHLIAVGCLFFWPLIGLDPLPGRLGYPLRALIMFLSTPFHTVLGLTVMQSSTLLGGDWYPSLGLTWADPFDDQRVAGGILWAGGEFVAVTMLGALVYQWMRESEREARRIDRALDRAEAEAALAEAASAAAAASGASGAAGALGAAAPAAGAEAEAQPGALFSVRSGPVHEAETDR